MSKAATRILAILEEFNITDIGKIFNEVVALKRARAIESPPKSAATTPEVVWSLLRKEILALPRRKGEEAEFDPHDCHAVGQVREGLSRVDCTMENVECDPNDDSSESWGSLIGPRMFGEVAGVGFWAGGDWEYPIFFLVYLAADKKTLLSYIPKDGNPWNHDAESAFGNHDADQEFLAARIREERPERKFKTKQLDPSSDGRLMFNEAKILADIAAHVLVEAKRRK